jgi:basic membrane protein A
MFKKTLALVLIAVFAIGILASCGTTTGGNAMTADLLPRQSFTKFDTKADFKIGVICLHDENSTYDLNFINSIKTVKEALGLKDEQVIVKTGIDEGPVCKTTADDLVSQGCKIVFADSFGHEAYMIEAAKAHPEVEFCHATGTKAHTENLSNYHNAFASIYEGRFLGGVAAGLKLNEMIESGKITAEQAKVGYIGAFPYAEVVSGFTSFFLGVRYVCPSATMEVTFTNSWYDPTLEKEGATKLISRNCVLLSEHADSMGAPTECQANGIPFVFYNGSAADACPDTFIVASRIDWAPYMKFAMQCVAEGKEIPADWTGTIATGSVKITDVNEQAAAAGTAEKLAEVQAALADGSLKVFDTATWTKDGATLTEYLADVDDMGDFVPETNVIADGYFHESEYRSAPYFDLFIDGITNIDA